MDTKKISSTPFPPIVFHRLCAAVIRVGAPSRSAAVTCVSPQLRNSVGSANVTRLPRLGVSRCVVRADDVMLSAVCRKAEVTGTFT